MLTVEVSVCDKNAGVVIVELLNDRGNGIVQLGGDQVAALASSLKSSLSRSTEKVLMSAFFR